MSEKAPGGNNGPVKPPEEKLEAFSGLHDYKNILSSITLLLMDEEESDAFIAKLRQEPLPSLEAYVEKLHITQVDLKQSIDEDIAKHPARVRKIDELILKLNKSAIRAEAETYFKEIKALL